MARQSESALMRELASLRKDLDAINRTRADVQANISASVADLTKTVTEHARRDEEQLHAIRVWMAEAKIAFDRVKGLLDDFEGRGQEPGIRGRLDRLEQAQARAIKRVDWACGVLGAVVASLVVALIVWLSSGAPK